MVSNRSATGSLRLNECMCVGECQQAGDLWSLPIVIVKSPSPIVIIKSTTGDAYSSATGCDSQAGLDVKD